MVARIIEHTSVRAMDRLLDDPRAKTLDDRCREKTGSSLATILEAAVNDIEPSNVNFATINRITNDLTKQLGLEGSTQQPLLNIALAKLVKGAFATAIQDRLASGLGYRLSPDAEDLLLRFTAERPGGTVASVAANAGSSQEASLRIQLQAQVDQKPRSKATIEALMDPNLPADSLAGLAGDIDLSRVDMVGLDHDYEIAALGMQKLPQAVGEAIAQAKYAAVCEQLTGFEPEDERFLEAFSRVAEEREGQPDFDATSAELVRLMLGRHFEAFGSEGGDTLTLRERLVRPLAELTTRIDRHSNERELASMIGGNTSDAAAESMNQRLSARLPTDAVELLARSGIGIWLVREQIDVIRVTPRYAEIYSPGLAALENTKAMPGDDTMARFDRPTHEAKAQVVGDTPVRSDVTLLVHELMHALDAVVSSVNPTWSSAWRKIFDQTERNEQRPDGKRLAFPTPYAGVSATEFFAECATIFLGTHVWVSRGSDHVITRDDLRDMNPTAYQALEELFFETLPRLNAEGVTGVPQQEDYQSKLLVAMDSALTRSLFPPPPTKRDTVRLQLDILALKAKMAWDGGSNYDSESALDAAQDVLKLAGLRTDERQAVQMIRDEMEAGAVRDQP